MLDIVRRMVWFFIVACAVAYIIFLVLGSTIQARAFDESRVVLIRDSLAVGAHYLSGIVMVPRTCSQLSMSYEKVSDALYSLDFTTWDEPSVPCKTEETPRSFRSVVFAPSTGISFIGALDGKPLQLSVIQVVEHSR
jgi:hypothetical protein